MDNPPITRIRNIMVKMISIVGAVYALIGVLGYSMFKSDIKGKTILKKETDQKLLGRTTYDCNNFYVRDHI